MSPTLQRIRHNIQGHVQGVGFRPFVYREATALTLTGFICNTHTGVHIELQGKHNALQAFHDALNTKLPPLASIHTHTQEHIPLQANDTGFQIIISQSNKQTPHTVLISPDMAPCKACLNEMFNPYDRRAYYPFINCTDCGPRITITANVPYDRHNTSMQCFPLCPDCAKEYHDPTNRRFHAQPNACAKCGPHIWLGTSGDDTDGSTSGDAPDEPQGHTKPRESMPKESTQDILQGILKALQEGKILAIKGLGGFHLVCDATNKSAIARLRERKHRPHKPLAVMVPDIDHARKLAHIHDAEATQLLSPERPIVLVRQRPNTLPANIAPDTAKYDNPFASDTDLGDSLNTNLGISLGNSPTLGIMLPSTPLHELILHQYQKPLVMTSGNASGDPICLGNREALTALAKIADLFVLHNRDILIRQDDSVLCIDIPQSHIPPETFSEVSPKVSPQTSLMSRRSRGFMPRPLRLPHKSPPILALGAMLKNTLCCTRGQEAFVSQHIGDLESPATLAFFEDMAERLPHFLHAKPEAIVADLHPDYPSTLLAIEYAEEQNIPLIQVQHHVAHAYAVLAEQGHTAPALALCLDGTGLGFDKTIWGGELLFVHPHALGTSSTHDAYIRLGHIQPMPMPAGDADVRAPWRLAAALASLHTDIPSTRPWVWETDTNQALMASHISSLVHAEHGFTTTSCGRLFDAVSALLGLCHTISHEGQAAIRLEHVANTVSICPPEHIIPLDIHNHSGCLQLDTHTLFRHSMIGWQQQSSIPLLAAAFHESLAQGLAKLAHQGAKSTNLTKVVLTGGVLHNARLRKALCKALHSYGLTPLLPQAFPPNDGSISLGQAMYANCLLHL